MKKFHNQAGFSAVEALIIILVLAVLGGIGYMVYHNHSASKTAVTKTQAGQQTSKKGSNRSKGPYNLSVNGVLTIAKWGVSMTVPAAFTTNSGSSVRYAFDDANNIELQSDLQAELPSSCSFGVQAKGPWGISRQHSGDVYTPAGQQPLTDSQAVSAGFVHIGDYFYQRTYPQTGCEDSATTQMTTLDSAYNNLFKTIKAE